MLLYLYLSCLLGINILFVLNHFSNPVIWLVNVLVTEAEAAPVAAAYWIAAELF